MLSSARYFLTMNIIPIIKKKSIIFQKNFKKGLEITFSICYNRKQEIDIGQKKMSKSIEKVSLDDINQIRLQGTQNGAELSAAQLSETSNITHKDTFVGLLTNERIIEFFEPYGYVCHQRMMDNNSSVRGIYVRCFDFECTFTDYDVFIWPYNGDDLEQVHNDYYAIHQSLPTFNMESFVKYCESVETTPEKAIESRITDELLGSLKKYSTTQPDFMQKRLRDNFKSIPQVYQKLVKNAYENQMLIAQKGEINEILKKYGSLANIEALMSRKD